MEDSYDENRTKAFLHWVEKAVAQHKEIVDVMLLDPGLKADLLRLYHRAFETRRQSSVSGGAETIQLFTNVMMHFLESQGQLPELHQTVVSACLTEASQDQCRRGKKLMPDPYVTAVTHSNVLYQG